MLFTFRVGAGDTYSVEWSLANDRISSFIIDVLIDLGGTSALFDSGVPEPGTPNGDVGRGVDVTSPGPPVVIAFQEFDAWPDADNAGDMYVQERISFENLRGGLDIRWLDDTDTIVPEPATALLLGAGLAIVAARRRRG